MHSHVIPMLVVIMINDETTCPWCTKDQCKENNNNVEKYKFCTQLLDASVRFVNLQLNDDNFSKNRN